MYRKTRIRSRFILVPIFLILISTIATIALLVALRWQQDTRSQAAPTASFKSYVPRGNPWDLWADTVIGQRDFGEVSAREIVPDKLNIPGGVVVDTSVKPGRMYVWDSGNNRILGVDLEQCYGRTSRCQPKVVIGQTSGSDYGACNQDASYSDYPNRAPASFKTLCGVWEGSHTELEDKSFASMAVDRSGNLYVPDANNNRVVVYNSPFTSDVQADIVLGQNDFSGNLCNKKLVQSLPGQPSEPIPNPTNSSICFSYLGGGVATDADENIWIADSNNNRVVRFPKGSKRADLVLGQSSFTTRNDTILANPLAVRVDDSGHVWVADSGHNRVLRYSEPYSIGMDADMIIGEPGDFNLITSIEFDPQGRGLWIADFTNGNKHSLWSFEGVPVENSTFSVAYHGGGSVGFDAESNMLVSNYYTADVKRYTYTQFPPNNCRQHDGNLDACNLEPDCAYYVCSGQCWPEGTPNTIGCSGATTVGGYVETKSLYSPPEGYNLTSAKRLENSAWTGLTVLGNQLVVSDGRLLFWNDLSSLSNGKSPDGFVGSSDILTIPQPRYAQVKSDAKSRLWASSSDRIDVFQGPLTRGQQKIASITGTVPILGGGSIALSSIHGIAVNKDGSALWVSMAYHQHRVVRITNPLTNPVVDIVLGQANASGTYCNRDKNDPRNEDAWAGQLDNDRLNTFCWPGAIELDKYGNLFVSDHLIEVAGNHRMLMFAEGTLQRKQKATGALYGVNATKVFPRGIGKLSHAHFGMAFNSKNQMVVGQNPYTGNRVLEYYKEPLKLNPADPMDAVFARPDGIFNDFYGWPVALAFDSNDNLYAYDANRSKVLIYKQPVFDY